MGRKSIDLSYQESVHLQKLRLSMDGKAFSGLQAEDYLGLLNAILDEEEVASTMVKPWGAWWPLLGGVRR